MIIKRTSPDTVTIFPTLNDDGSISEQFKLSGTDRLALQEDKDCRRIILADGFTSVLEREFLDLSHIEEIVLNDGILEIQKYAFMRCESLKKLYMPASVNKLGTAIFSQLKSVTVIYGGQAEQFDALTTVTEVEVTVPSYGGYDGYPYYIHEPIGFSIERELEHFDKYCDTCLVLCQDGTTLHYGTTSPIELSERKEKH